MAATTAPRRSRLATDGSTGTLADSVSYWLIVTSVYVLQAFLWYYSARQKLVDDDGVAPPPVQKQFDGTFVDTFPGVDASWVILGVLQAVVFVAVVASLLAREWLPGRRKPILLGSLSLAMIVFAVMGFAQSLTKQYDSVAHLYSYFGATAVVIVLLLLMPPYRPACWLTSFTGRGSGD